MLVQNTMGDERQPLSLKSWAVETDAEPAHNAVWRQRDIELLNVDLAEYVEALDQQLANSIDPRRACRPLLAPKERYRIVGVAGAALSCRDPKKIGSN